MRASWKKILSALLGAIVGGLGFASYAQAELAPGMVEIPAGIYHPLFRGEKDPKEVSVSSFALDSRPVTNADFLAFVTANPRWQRSQVKRLFADQAYLQQWISDLSFGPPENAHRPVVFVSWFAAKAFATWKGRRLPTTTEWELAASAGFTSASTT